jgi:hypothetical protein
VIYQTLLMPMIRLGGVVLHPPQVFSNLCLFNSLKSVSFNLKFYIMPSFLTVFKAFQGHLKDHLICEILSSHSGDANDSNLQSCDAVPFGEQSLRFQGTE